MKNKKNRIRENQETGARILKILIDKNMMQRELARAIGVNDSTISQYIHGDMHIPQERLERIATVLGVSVEILREVEHEKDTDTI